MGLDEIEEAFLAGYHCQWNKDLRTFIFDPAMSPGDPDGAYRAWLLTRREKCATLTPSPNERT